MGVERRFGKEVILDMYGCDINFFTKEKLTEFFTQLCKKIDMKKYGKPKFWKDNSQIIHLKGISAVQFITTSNITIHALDILGAVYLNIFSCKNFDANKAAKFSKDFFRAEKVRVRVMERR